MIKPKISIIIPVYNTSKVINRTLRSVEQQTYLNYEMIIVNDGSTDGTKELLDKYVASHDNNIIIHHQENKGVSAARNKGIELASGEFICFLDSDDTYAPTFLEKILSHIQKTDTKAVFCFYNKIDGDQITCYEAKYSDKNQISTFLEPNGYFTFCAMLLHKNILSENDIKFNEKLKLAEDILFTIQVMNKTKLDCVPEYLYNYYQRENSATLNKWNQEDWMNEICGWKTIYNYLLENYYKSDKDRVLNRLKKIIIQKELAYLMEQLKGFKYKVITEYVNSNSSIRDLEYLNLLDSRGDRKKFKCATSNNSFLLFFGTLYYRYLRVNLKRNLLKEKR